MKWVDDSIELVACGSSYKDMPTFGIWEETVLRECYEHIDYLSLHNYYGNRENNTEDYLASSLDMDVFIKSVTAICDKIKEEKKSDKQTIFYPYYHALRYGQGTALDISCECESYSTDKHSNIPYVESIATIDEEGTGLTVFAVNRSLTDSCPLELSFDKPFKFSEHLVVTGEDVNIVNSAEEERITEARLEDGDHLSLPPLSWNVIRFKL